MLVELTEKEIEWLAACNEEISENQEIEEDEPLELWDIKMNREEVDKLQEKLDFATNSLIHKDHGLLPTHYGMKLDLTFDIPRIGGEPGPGKRTYTLVGVDRTQTAMDFPLMIRHEDGEERWHRIEQIKNLY